ncbi:hypothetical protein [Chitinophaga sp. 22620]
MRLRLPGKNPYRTKNGTTFADPDGFRFVILTNSISL